jgi:hypothetical protein
MKAYEALLVATLTYQAGLFAGQCKYKAAVLFVAAAVAIGCFFAR